MLSALAVTSQASAGLIVRDGGMIYDDVLDITWLQDANYAKTSGYEPEGKMTWDESMPWADNLVYGGFDDWRLFNAFKNDSNCDRIMNVGYFGHNCIKGEMAQLWYNGFELAKGEDLSSATGLGLANVNLFKNIQLDLYYSSLIYNDLNAGIFHADLGYQTPGSKNGAYAWAVRDGDVGGSSVNEVPEPGSLAILGLGLLGLSFRQVKHSR